MDEPRTGFGRESWRKRGRPALPLRPDGSGIRTQKKACQSEAVRGGEHTCFVRTGRPDFYLRFWMLLCNNNL